MDVMFLETKMLFSFVASNSSLHRKTRDEMLNWLKFDWLRLEDMDSTLTNTSQAPQSITKEPMEVIELNTDETNTESTESKNVSPKAEQTLPLHSIQRPISL